MSAAIHFLAGLPRSGSTYLGGLLAQHPHLHVSPTSDLVEAVVQLRNSWVTFDGWRAQGLEVLRPRIRRMLRAMMEGFYGLELDGGMAVLDKSRAWPGYIDILEDVLGRPVRIICPLRDPKGVVASFERLRSSHPLTAPHGKGDDYLAQADVMGRARHLLSDTGTVGLPARRILDALDRGFGDRLLLVAHSNLLRHPVPVCAEAFAFLGLDCRDVDPERPRQPDTRRDIDTWGLPLHRLHCGPVSSDSEGWREVLPLAVGAWIDEQLGRMQELVRVLSGGGSP